jgi:hypothetical protein
MAFQERGAGLVEEGLVRTTQVVEELGEFFVALVRVWMYHLTDDFIDPDGDLALVMQQGLVLRFVLCGLGPGLCDLRAIGQLAGQHLVGDHAQSKHVRV